MEGTVLFASHTWASTSCYQLLRLQAHYCTPAVHYCTHVHLLHFWCDWAFLRACWCPGSTCRHGQLETAGAQCCLSHSGILAWDHHGKLRNPPPPFLETVSLSTIIACQALLVMSVLQVEKPTILSSAIQTNVKFTSDISGVFRETTWSLDFSWATQSTAHVNTQDLKY